MTHPNSVSLSIVIPVRNEPECISFIVKVLEALIDVSHELLVVTDVPTDTTVPAIHALAEKFPNLKHVQNEAGPGVLNAVCAGVKAACGEYVMIYAADEIGPVLAIPTMLTLMNRGCDFISATRYAKGGKRYGGSKMGHFLSRTANSLFNFFTATAFTDCTTGLKVFKRELFSHFHFEKGGSGWSFAFDMAIQAQLLKLRIGEVPIVSIDRLFGGESTMRLIPWIRSYIKCFIKGIMALPPWHSPKPQLDFQPPINHEKFSY